MVFTVDRAIRFASQDMVSNQFTVVNYNGQVVILNQQQCLFGPNRRLNAGADSCYVVLRRGIQLTASQAKCVVIKIYFYST